MRLAFSQRGLVTKHSSAEAALLAARRTCRLLLDPVPANDRPTVHIEAAAADAIGSADADLAQMLGRL